MRTSSVLRRSLTAAGVALATVAVSGCLSLETRFDIGADGTADVGITMLFDLDRLREFGEMFGEDTSELDDLSGEELVEEFGEGDNPCEDFSGEFTGRTETESVTDGGKRGISCTIADVPIDELSDFSAEDGSSFSITQDDEGTSIEMVFPSEDLTADSDEMTAMLGLTFQELFDISFVVSAPGELVEHNATSTDGSTATWQLTPDAEFLQGGEAVMSARWSGFSESGGGGDDGSSTLLIVAIIAGVVVVAGAVLLILRARSSGGDDTDAGAPGGTDPGTMAPPAPQMPPGAPAPPPPPPNAPPPPPPPAP